MILKKLQLTHFRNYIGLNLELGSEVTILIGDNAQGKSNLLESMYFLATSKSSKADKEEEMILYDKDFLVVKGELDDKTYLEVVMQKIDSGIHKRVKVNGISRRMVDYNQNLTVILFAPEDLNLVTGSPSLRRSHIDQLLSQVDSDYKKSLHAYEAVIIRKNKVLRNIKEGVSSEKELSFWCDKQLQLGNVLFQKRSEFFEFLNSSEKKFGEYVFEYVPSVLDEKRLLQYRLQEIEAATSLIGSHRDDYRFFLAGRDLEKYGSRGQQRTAVLDMKFTELLFVEKKSGSRPVLLLDDIFSELDLDHRKHVATIALLQQTVITTVELDSYIKKLFKHPAYLKVEQGRVDRLKY